ncbi:MAG TPA: hypothetical protein VNM91_04835 [Dehalococcoidia bacterium]|nr:hypothetical protein [Dehalococcoidia bacterium]
MARIVLGSYMVRYPLGGMMSWVLQYIVGFQRLGHEIWFVEKAGYANSCFDPIKNQMSDDCTYGTSVLNELLSRFGLEDRWCFVDAADEYHGVPRARIEAVLRSADVFVDMGTHGAWLEQAAGAGMRVLVDGEPGMTQMKWQKRLDAGGTLDAYDRYYTTGRNIGTEGSSAPAAGREWRHIFHPVVCDLFPAAPPPDERAPYTTVMNWQSYEPVTYRGRTYGHKDTEFEKFIGLPARCSAQFEAAISGANVPYGRLTAAGWQTRDAHAVTISFDSFRDYIAGSKGEFSVCKNGYVATNSGWFSDRGAAYLASGRPVVQQETGFSAHLPCGEGLFAVRDVDEAAAAIDEVERDYQRHARRAREIARERLDATVVLGGFLRELGV